MADVILYLRLSCGESGGGAECSLQSVVRPPRSANTGTDQPGPGMRAPGHHGDTATKPNTTQQPKCLKIP